MAEIGVCEWNTTAHGDMHVIRRSNRIDHSWDLYARVAYRASVDISTLLNDKLCSFRVKRVVFLSSIRNDSRLICSPRKSRESWRSGGQDLRDLVKDTHSQFRIFETRGGVGGSIWRSGTVPHQTKEFDCCRSVPCRVRKQRTVFGIAP